MNNTQDKAILWAVRGAGICLGILAVVLILVLAGCNSSSSSGHLSAGAKASASAEAAKAKASAKALASSAAVQADEARAKAILTRCINQTGTAYLVLHPIAGPRKVYFCVVATVDAAKPGAGKCSKAVLNANGIGHGKLTLDEVGIAKCLSTA